MDSKKKQKIYNIIMILLQLSFYVLALVFFERAKWLYQSDVGSGYHRFGNFYISEFNYVGGDAYNYIITAARSSAVMIKSLIWVVLGCSSILVGRTFRLKN